MKANFGLLPELPVKIRCKKDRNKQMAIRAINMLEEMKKEIRQ
jgi:methylenetetrahydrofolate--tRNA-(uracil-5-)-methyltransferase